MLGYASFPPEQDKILFAIVGPNGVGKTTFYRHFLRQLGWPYVNADALARAFWDDHLAEETGREDRDRAAARMTDLIRDQMLEGEETADFVAGRVAALPLAQREVFLMRVVEGLSFKEIAEALKIPLNTALGRMHYAVGRLRTELLANPAEWRKGGRT